MYPLIPLNHLINININGYKHRNQILLEYWPLMKKSSGKIAIRVKFLRKNKMVAIAFYNIPRRGEYTNRYLTKLAFPNKIPFRTRYETKLPYKLSCRCWIMLEKNLFSITFCIYLEGTIWFASLNGYDISKYDRKIREKIIVRQNKTYK